MRVARKMPVNAVVGATVTATITSAGGEAKKRTATTDGSGRATFDGVGRRQPVPRRGQRRRRDHQIDRVRGTGGRRHPHDVDRRPGWRCREQRRRGSTASSGGAPPMAGRCAGRRPRHARPAHDERQAAARLGPGGRHGQRARRAQDAGQRGRRRRGHRAGHERRRRHQEAHRDHRRQRPRDLRGASAPAISSRPRSRSTARPSSRASSRCHRPAASAPC